MLYIQILLNLIHSYKYMNISTGRRKHLYGGFKKKLSTVHNGLEPIKSASTDSILTATA